MPETRKEYVVCVMLGNQWGYAKYIKSTGFVTYHEIEHEATHFETLKKAKALFDFLFDFDSINGIGIIAVSDLEIEHHAG